MKLVSAKTQQLIILMMRDVDKYQKVFGVAPTGQVINKGKYSDARRSLIDAFSEEDLSERLYNVAPYVFKDWEEMFVAGEYSELNEASYEEVRNSFTPEGIPEDLIEYKASDDLERVVETTGKD